MPAVRRVAPLLLLAGFLLVLPGLAIPAFTQIFLDRVLAQGRQDWLKPLLVAADEARARCYLGLILARPDYLTAGQNKDAKRSVSAMGFGHILWLLRDHPYPANFWRSLPEETVTRIFSGATGNERMARLFRLVQGRPVDRDVVEAVAQQKDFMRRIRSDKGRGTRDILEREGILLLSGQYDGQLIRALDLPACPASAFVSCQPETEQHRRMALQAGFDLPRA